jgi:NitT/TauT family transport system substrate-binding protein
LLSLELTKGRLDAVLTFWPFAARLESQGYRRLASMQELMQSLGFSPPVPMLGYAFSESWITTHAETARRFMTALDKADGLMAEDAEWDSLKPLTGATDDATLAALRKRFLAGLIAEPADSANGAARLYALRSAATA